MSLLALEFVVPRDTIRQDDDVLEPKLGVKSRPIVLVDLSERSQDFPYAWFGLGSGGEGSSLSKTQVDSAIISEPRCLSVRRTITSAANRARPTAHTGRRGRVRSPPHARAQR